jgi:hypothetical protein
LLFLRLVEPPGNPRRKSHPNIAESVNVRALNEVDEWGPSDHCRIVISVDLWPKSPAAIRSPGRAPFRHIRSHRKTQPTVASARNIQAAVSTQN